MKRGVAQRFSDQLKLFGKGSFSQQPEDRTAELAQPSLVLRQAAPLRRPLEQDWRKSEHGKLGKSIKQTKPLARLPPKVGTSVRAVRAGIPSTGP